MLQKIKQVSLEASKNNFTDSYSPLEMSISYEEKLSEEVLLNKISTIPNAQVVFWYIGSHGFKEDGVKFYKNKISKILSGPNDACCWLMDLTAWGAFFNRNIKITQTSKCVEQINNFNLEKLKCILASQIFKEMQELNPEEIVTYFKRHVVSRSSLSEVSQSFKQSEIKIGEIFNNRCPILENLYDKDTAKHYSVVQYIEGCFIVKHILENALENKGDIEIVFALPNDESKYYFDIEENFLHDTRKLIESQFKDQLYGRKLHISFFTFEFGSLPHERPYNSGKKILKRIQQSDVFDTKL